MDESCRLGLGCQQILDRGPGTIILQNGRSSLSLDAILVTTERAAKLVSNDSRGFRTFDVMNSFDTFSSGCKTTVQPGHWPNSSVDQVIETRVSDLPMFIGRDGQNFVPCVVIRPADAGRS